MTVHVPNGYRMAGGHYGIKNNPKMEDLALIVSDVPAVAAGVYTTNLVKAAPVVLDQSRTPSDDVRAVVANSGNANACTGERGVDDAAEMARAAAASCGAAPGNALVLSTGIIGEFLPMEKIKSGINDLSTRLGNDDASLVAAARGLMTTDTVHKIAFRTLAFSGENIQITGMAKGAAMIGPNMATMLGLIMTDASIDKEDAQKLLRTSVEDSFNCISVDGHTSTNDTVLLLANGAAGQKRLSGAELSAFGGMLDNICQELAMAIPADGEGATHLIVIEITGAKDKESARKIAKTVADSPLVKTAIAGADPNWGRIVSAVGYAGVPLEPSGISLVLNGISIYEKGSPVEFDAQVASDLIRDNRETVVQIKLSEGDAAARFWTSDLTAEYVRLNADYHT